MGIMSSIVELSEATTWALDMVVWNLNIKYSDGYLNTAGLYSIVI